MARIVYGVQGDSNGHIRRSLTVAELLNGHEILFAGGGAVFRAREHGFTHEPLPLLATPSRRNRVDLIGTAVSCGRAIADRSRWIRRLADVIRSFDPALVITDYEYFTPLAAARAGRRCISLDHQHVLTRTVYEPPPDQRVSRWLAEAAITHVMSRASRFLMSSFHHPPVRDPARDELFGTLPANDVLGLASVDGEHGVVYVRGGDLDRIRPLLGGRRREYRVYGFGRAPEWKNLRFRTPSREGFLQDLASCAYVVSNGGHGLLSECLVLGKPTLCFPTRLHYEQYWNGVHIARNGYGACHMRLDIPRDAVDAFESGLNRYRAAIAARDFCGREPLRTRLEALIRDHGPAERTPQPVMMAAPGRSTASVQR